MDNLPSGTVTFLFTDIEGSTRLWQEKPEAMATAHARHDKILREAIEANNGYVFQIVGDSFSAAFHNTIDGLRAVLSAQRALHETQTSEFPENSEVSLRVRMGLHTGTAVILPDGKYEGYATLALTQRIMAAGHGGQILLSQSTYDLTRDSLPENAQLVDMGERRLKDIHRPEHLYQLSVQDLPSQFAPLNTLESFNHNLPAQLTSFIGREKEIVEINALLQHSRLVTLTGSGGTGKTRLSIEIGAEQLTSFENGVWLIELAPLADPAQIIPAMAQVFGLQENPFALLASLVTDYLRDKKILLILDNCEHLIAACARLVDDLLHQCAGLKILASSREALGIAGEVAYRTPSLSSPPALGGVPAAEDGGLSKIMNYESTSLFVERARAANSKFSPTESNTSSIAQICHRLDGIPLAIELAAARTKLLSVEQIAAHLDDLFRLLVGGSRTALPRQQTLRALIDWSYDLLSEEEKQLLRNASVFMGGWTLDALESISDDPNAIEHLEGLVNKSLVVTEERENEMRYFLLETIRQYAREKMFDAKQAANVRDRHFAYFDDLSERMWNAFRLQDSLAFRDMVDDELENLRTALEWGFENHVEDAVHLAANFCIVSGWTSNQTEGLVLVKSAIERARSLPPEDESTNHHRLRLIAKALFAQGLIGMGDSEFAFGVQALQEAIAISRTTGDKLMLGYSLEVFSGVSTFINVPGGAEAAEEGFSIFTNEIDDKWGLGMAYLNMARIAGEKGDLSEKQKYYAKLKEMLRDGPISFLTAFFFLGMGVAESIRGNYPTAQGLFEDALNVFRRARNTFFQLVVASELGHLARHNGDISQARKTYRETIKGWGDLGDRSAIAHQLECFAFIAIADEEPQRAIKLFGAAEALRKRIGAQMTDYEQIEYDQSVAQLRAMLTAKYPKGEAEFNTLWAEGRTMTMEQAIQLALEATYE